MGLTAIPTVMLKLGHELVRRPSHAMSACATSGFSTKNASVAYSTAR